MSRSTETSLSYRGLVTCHRTVKMVAKRPIPSMRLKRLWGGGGAGQGWHSGESTHLPPMCPRFSSWTQHHMCVEFVVAFLLAPRVFLRVLSTYLFILNEIQFVEWQLKTLTSTLLKNYACLPVASLKILVANTQFLIIFGDKEGATSDSVNSS